MIRIMSHTPPPLPDGQIALFFDIDGTLAPIAERPEQACIPGETITILQMLRQYTGGAVAFISGRNLEEIDRLSGGPYPAAGQHGLEMRGASGAVERQEQHREVIVRVAEHLRAIAAEHPGLLVEEKGLSVALHYRQAPKLAGLVERALVALEAQYAGLLCLQRGKMVGELRIAGGGKGAAIRSLAETAPFAGKTPIFVGDDLTDEEGFHAVNALGGISIKIGEGDTNAQWRIDSVDHLGSWLRRLALHVGRTHG